MTLTEQDVDVYECPACGSLGRQEDVSCCGESREPVETAAVYNQPEMEAVIKTVFDLSSTHLAICRVLMTDGESTVKELTAQFSLDRSTINRCLNHLAELGIVRKEWRILQEGGAVHEYSTAPIDDVHRRLQLGLYSWLADAEGVLDEMHQARLKRMVEEAEAGTETARTDEDGTGLTD